MKTLTVFFLHDATVRPINLPGVTYRVASVEQSTDFFPGQYLTKPQVQELCDIPRQWRVVIKPFPKA